MKKLSLIAGLACLATVGGVFGAWVFGSDAATTAQAEKVATQITVDTVVNANAAISAEVAGPDLSLDFGQSAENSLKPVGTATLSAAEDYTITITDNSDLDEYDSTYRITSVKFVVGTNSLGIVPETSLTCTDTASASKVRTYAVDVDEIDAAFANMADISAGTQAGVDMFKTAVEALTYKLVFSVEVTRTPKA